uniref:P-type ATPase A domain-containing protein n=1 Tax=Chenopodium quinoa TaxID=63459 RepID=A0A803MS89_CHEQI
MAKRRVSRGIDWEANFLKFLHSILNPRMLATIIAVVIGWDQNFNWPWPVMVVVILLHLMTSLNIIKSENVINENLTTLMTPLAKKVKVLRDGRWTEEHSTLLVPGDVINIEAGDIIQADVRLLGEYPVVIDEYVITGQDMSLVIKRTGDAAYSSCICEHGTSEAVIVATGNQTAFRNKVFPDDTPHKVRYLERVLAGIWNVCICMVAVGMLVQIAVMYPFQHRAFRTGIDNLLVILIAGIPIAPHANVSFIIYRGSQILALKGAILKRWAAIKEIADMDVLCTDTSGILAMNKLTADKNLVGLGTLAKLVTVSSLLEHNKDKTTSASLFDDLIEKPNASSESTYGVVEQLQARKLRCGMIGNDINDVPALKKADIGIATENATDVDRRASDIVLTEPGLNVIIKAVLICRKISQKIKEYLINTLAMTAHTILVFMLLTSIWKFDFPPLLMLQIVVFDEVLSCTFAPYRVKQSLLVADRWGMLDILKLGIVIGVYLALGTIIFFWTACETDFFQRVFGVASLLVEAPHSNNAKLVAAVYLQVSISLHSLIFFTQSRKWSSVIRDGSAVLMFLVVQLLANLIAVYADWGALQGIGWSWAGVIWLYNIILYILLLSIKVLGAFMLSLLSRS